MAVAPASNIAPQETFNDLLTRAGSPTAIQSFVTVEKPSKGKFELVLTEKGSALDADFQRAYHLAEEKGPRDADVLAILEKISAAWPAYPGVVENAINDAVEAKTPERAVEAAEAAVADWFGLLSAAGIKDLEALTATGSATGLLIQLLANYEFALERSNSLEQALGVAQLARAIDPRDPENLLSAVANLSIRLGTPEVALTELASLQDSAAPFVLYGRALAYFAMGQPENATAALQTALRHWPQVAQGIGREWTTGTPMPRPGEAVSEAQVLYGYYEVFGQAWTSVPGALDWLRKEEQAFQRSGGKQAQHVGLTRSGVKTDQGVQSLEDRQKEALAKANVVGQDEYIRLLEVGKHQFVYDLTEAGRAAGESLKSLFQKELKHHERLDALKSELELWPGNTEAAITLARICGGEKKWDEALDVLEAAIFDLQKFWSDDFVGKNRIEIDWPGNNGLLRTYAHMVVYLAHAGDNEAARNFASDYLAINPKDNLGVRQKAIELAFADGDIEEAMRLIEEASDPNAAYNMFGRALALFAKGKKDEATKVLHQAIQNRPKVYRELTSDRHRMPAKYNPSYVSFFSAEEAYNYYSLWGNLWRNTMGALAWLRKEGRAAMATKKAA